MPEREHFASSLGAWTAITAGDGTVTITDSQAKLEMSGAVGGAVIYRALPHTKDHLFACCVRSAQQNPSPRMRIFDKATAPAHGSPGTEAFNVDFYVGSTTRGRLNHWTTGGTQQIWNGSTFAWQTANVDSVPTLQFDDSHIVGYQWDAAAARVRFFFINVSTGSTQTEACGPKLFGLSDWVALSAIRGGTSSTLWIALGHFDNGNGYTGTCAIEWTRFEEGPKILAATNQAATAGAYSTKLWESFGGRFQLPSGASPQRTSLITQGGTQPWCAYQTQFGCGIKEDNGDLWFFFNGKATSGGANSVGVTKSTDGGVTWTPYASNPIIAAVASTDLNNLVHMGCVKDMLEPDANKRYKLVVTSQLGNGDRKILLFTAAQPDTTSWTNEGVLAGPDGDSATGYENVHMNPIHYNGEWLLMNGAWLWRGPRLTVADLTKSAFDLDLDYKNVSQVASTISSTSRNVTVTSSTGFVEDALVLIDDDTSGADWALNRVRKNVDAANVELYHRTPGYAANCTINRADAGKVTLHAIRYDPQRREWCFYISFFAPFDLYNNSGAVDAFPEMSGLAVSASPLLAPTIDWFDCPQAWLARNDNHRSSENMKFFDPPVRGDLLHGYPKRPPRVNAALRR